jgi:UDP-galactopyranose mutase
VGARDRVFPLTAGGTLPRYDYLIVGAGFFGAVFARQMADAGRRCLLIDRREHIGGNCYTHSVDGIDVHRYGPHIFHTRSGRIWEFINRFTTFHPYRHRARARCGGRLFTLPVNLMTLHQLWGVSTPAEALAELERRREPIAEPANFEQWALAHVGREIYELFFRGYTLKQWGRDPKELPASILKRLPIRLDFNDEYFDDTFQGIPVGGYTPIFEKLLAGIDVRLGCDYFSRRAELERLAGKIAYTGMVDQFFDYRLGHLEWRSLRFEMQRLAVEDLQGGAIVNYCDAGVPFTRIAEFRHFVPGHVRPKGRTVISREYPQRWQPGTEPFYPVNTEHNESLLMQYRAMKPEHVIFGGRLGDYRYYDMDQVIGSALARAKAELAGGETGRIWQVGRANGRTPGVRSTFAPTTPGNIFDGDLSMQTQTHNGETPAASGSLAPSRLYRLETPAGAVLARNAILHECGEVFSEYARLHRRRWQPMRGGGDGIFIGGEPWRARDGRLVSQSFSNARSGRFQPSAGRQVRLTHAFPSPGQTGAVLAPQRPIPGRGQFEVVIAKYREDIRWSDAIAANRTVYCKDTNCGDCCPHLPLPNIGREYGTYLHHIVTRYDTLAERTLFVQGDPFFHHLLPIEEFACSDEGFHYRANFHRSMSHAVNWGWAGQTATMAVKTEFLKLLDCRTDIKHYDFTWGAQFSVTAERIRLRPKSYYEKLRELAHRPGITLAGVEFDNLHIGFLFEFFWQNIFCPEFHADRQGTPWPQRREACAPRR